MTRTQYEQVAALISQIRNAKFGQMVGYLEELIETGIWRDYTAPDDTHFEFRACEFDYFLAAEEIDPDLVKRAYIHAKNVDGLAAKRAHLADITGRGVAPAEGDRRPAEEVACTYGQSGAGARILAWDKAHSTVVTRNVSSLARDHERRAAAESGREVKLSRRKYWTAEWTNDDTPVRAIADKLLADPDLAREVLKILRADYDHKRRSEAGNGLNVPAHKGG